VPDLLEYQMGEALNVLGGAVDARDAAAVRQAAIAAAQASLDLQLAHRDPAAIDLARLHLWTQQLLLDAGAGDQHKVVGDVTSIEWMQDRIAASVGPDTLAAIAALTGDLRAAADAGDLAAATGAATQLRDLLDQSLTG
jgi:hypothetical protein